MPVEIYIARAPSRDSEGPAVKISAESKLPEWSVAHIYAVLKRLGQGPIADVYTALDALEEACTNITVT